MGGQGQEDDEAEQPAHLGGRVCLCVVWLEWVWDGGRGGKTRHYPGVEWQLVIPIERACLCWRPGRKSESVWPLPVRVAWTPSLLYRGWWWRWVRRHRGQAAVDINRLSPWGEWMPPAAVRPIIARRPPHTQSPSIPIATCPGKPALWCGLLRVGACVLRGEGEATGALGLLSFQPLARAVRPARRAGRSAKTRRRSIAWARLAGDWAIMHRRSSCAPHASSPLGRRRAHEWSAKLGRTAFEGSSRGTMWLATAGQDN